MIWGKTYEEKEALGKIISEYENKHRWFAWYPYQLKDGRWLWLEWVWREYIGGISGEPSWIILTEGLGGYGTCN